MEIFLLLVFVAICGVCFWVGYTIGQESILRQFSDSSAPSFEGTVEESNYSNSGQEEVYIYEPPKNISAYLQLQYIAASGEKTERNVRVQSFQSENPEGLFRGHCELRGSHRSFRFDRVNRMVDMETGEVSKDVRGYLTGLYKESPGYLLEKFETENRDLLKVLFYIAKADGRYVEAEKVVIRSFLKDLAIDSSFTDEMFDLVFKQMAVPTPQAFEQAVDRLFEDENLQFSEIESCCKKIVATGKSTKDKEQKALDYIASKPELMVNR